MSKSEQDKLMELYKSYVGKKWAYYGRVIAIGCLYEHPPANEKWGEEGPRDRPYFGMMREAYSSYDAEPCEDIVSKALLVFPDKPSKCDSEPCRSEEGVSGYLTKLNGKNYCPQCSIHVVAKVCFRCACLATHSSLYSYADGLICSNCRRSLSEAEKSKTSECQITVSRE